MPKSDSLTSISISLIKQTVIHSRLKLRHLVALFTSLPMLVISMVSKEPILAGSLFIALIAMMLDQLLFNLVRRLNSRIKFWQVSVAIIVAAVFVSQWLNPVNATPDMRFAIPMQQEQMLVTETISIKLVIVVLNLLLMTAIFYVAVFVRGLWIKKTTK